jgi:hypothetical protein
MKLGTHMLGGERRKPIDIEDRRTKVKSAYNMMNGVRAAQSFPHNILRMKCLI